MKKLGLGLLGLIVIVVLYYFTVGSKQITSMLQAQLDAELTRMQAQGFGVSDRKKTEAKEHFIISLEEAKKASLYFEKRGLLLSEEEAKKLKGAKLGVDVFYLKSGIAFDLYPLALPTRMNTLATNENDRQLLIQLEKMIEKKTFLVHADIDYTATTFKGYMKDMNETVQNEGEEIKLATQGLHFSGYIKDGEIVELKQTLEALHLYTSSEMGIHILGLKSAYISTGTTVYDYTADYTIKTIQMNSGFQGTLLADGFTLHSASSVKDGLAAETLKTKIQSIKILNSKEHMGLKNSVLDVKVNNLDVDAFEKLQNVDPNNEQELNVLLQQLISKNVHLEISNLSADKVTLEGKNMEGFWLDAMLDIDKSLDISSLETNPISALDKVDANFKISLSKELFDMVSQHPKAMIVLMVFKPEISLGKYIYRLKLKDGSLSVNGKPIR